MNVLLVSPETPSTFWSFRYVVRFVSKRAVFPPLGLLTVASMLPRSWQLKLVDLNVSRLRTADIRWADYVMISGMIVHRESVRDIVARCRAQGRTIIGGGPLFTTGHEEFADDVHAVIGEAEDIIPELVRDMESGMLKPSYQTSDHPDIRRTPTPRWDLIQRKHYVTMPVQFSRGCPYNCEFCDIIVMNGRIPRTKSPAQMLAELDALRQGGWDDQVFIVDDNFIGNKVRVKEFLRELIQWRERTGSHMGFFTEASVNLADDPELLDLMAQAGFHRVFLGIETPNATSLEECQKQQNTRLNLAEAIRTIQAAGMEVMGGFIVGFDNDPENIFE
ncbi:MAG: B12-binding domain-containing radical SAM protein, partial [Planctomycetes bacterium]|nr:B12-binding domain-containing radical SAM protein [Planctomycetota bacterium]